MTRYLFLQIVFDKWEPKDRVRYTYYTNNGYTSVIQVQEDYNEFDREQAKNKKIAGRQKTSTSISRKCRLV